MRPHYSLTLALSFALVVAACEPAPAVSNPEFNQLSLTVEDLVARVRNLENDRAALQAQVDELRGEDAATPFQQSAEFDPTDSSYLRVDGKMTPFAVSIADVRPFGDGVRVKIKLGNVSAATFTGAKLSIQYGPRAPTDGDKSQWESKLQWKEQAVTNSLRPGHWNPIDVTLPTIDAKQLGYMKVWIHTDVVALSQ